MSVNVTTTPPLSWLGKFLGDAINAAKIIALLMSFPAISLPALDAFYMFYGKLEQALPENFLLNTAQKDIVVTKHGYESHNIAPNALKLVSGTYILVPKSHEDEVAKNMDRLIVAQGYLNPRDSPASTPPDRLVEAAVPTVSYVSLNVKVQPRSAVTKTA